MTISDNVAGLPPRPARARFALKLLLGLLAAAIVLMLLSGAMGGGALYGLLAKVYFYGVAPLGFLAVMVFGGWATFRQTNDQNMLLGMAMVVVGGLLLTGSFIFAIVGGVGTLTGG